MEIFTRTRTDESFWSDTPALPPEEKARAEESCVVPDKRKADPAPDRNDQIIKTFQRVSDGYSRRLASDNRYCLPVPTEQLACKAIPVAGVPQITVTVVEYEVLCKAAQDAAAGAIADSLADEASELEYYFAELAVRLLNADPQATSEKDLEQIHWETIEAMKQGYLNVFMQAFDKMSAFYKAFIAVKATLAAHISAGSKEGQIKFTYESFREKLQNLLTDFSGTDGQLFPPPDAGGNYGVTDKKTAEDWIKIMGLSADSLKSDGSGGYWVQIDLKPLESMIENFDGFKWPGLVEMALTEYNAWEVGFNTQADFLNNALQTLTQKLSYANSSFNQRVEILTRFIQQEAEVQKEYLR
ncbi:IpaD/SipD/SspD family type III secretion system needle tip protein [Pantoea sp. B65]|uniref:IpaD/SipD/SspD family type III secretion system needle tip protein n=1 Tax=Pantoea sp. B65 TaxID=2813359 RepID=UPI0039B3BF8E